MVLIMMQVDAAIVRIMKTRKVLSHTLLITELFQQVTKTQQKSLFLLLMLKWVLKWVNDTAEVPDKTGGLEEEDREPDRPRVSGARQEQPPSIQLPGMM